jgi:hypothetical protein
VRDADRAAGFIQTYTHVAGDVYNVNGDLILTKTSTKDDFVREVRKLKEQLAALEELPGQDRHELESQLEETAEEAAAPTPRRDRIVERLNAVKERLDSLEGAAGSAVKLATTIGSVAVWAGKFFV